MSYCIEKGSMSREKLKSQFKCNVSECPLRILIKQDSLKVMKILIMDRFLESK
jgi:hypothetical protein